MVFFFLLFTISSLLIVISTSLWMFNNVHKRLFPLSYFMKFIVYFLVRRVWCVAKVKWCIKTHRKTNAFCIWMTIDSCNNIYFSDPFFCALHRQVGVYKHCTAAFTNTGLFHTLDIILFRGLSHVPKSRLTAGYQGVISSHELYYFMRVLVVTVHSETKKK